MPESSDTCYLGTLEPSVDDVVGSLIVAELGGYHGNYRRESGRAVRRLIYEVYSQPRITQELSRSHFKRVFAPGLALDLTIPDPLDNLPLDFTLKSKRDRARQLMAEQEPILLIGSPE